MSFNSILIINDQSLFSRFLQDFGNLATILSVAVVIIIYYIERRTKKIAAARLVLNEINVVLPLVDDILEKRKYDLKIDAITTEHWRDQSHLIASKMNQMQISHIEKIYSIGRSIQKHMEAIKEYKRAEYAKIYREALEKTCDANEAVQDVINSKEVSSRVSKVNGVDDSLMSSFVQEAVKEIKDAKSWKGYRRLCQIARVKE